MKICILGAGSLGSAIGAALAEAGSDVALVNRSATHVAAISAWGLEVTDERGTRHVRVRATTDVASVGTADLVVVLVKSFDTRSAITRAAAPDGPIGAHTAVLSLQNGLGHEEILAEVVGHGRVLAGKTYAGGVMTGPGRVVSGVSGKATIIGELDGGISERVRTIAAEFERAGLAITISRNIGAAMWDKLFVNVATGGLSAITGLAYGDLYAVAEVKTTALAAVTEAMAVARAAGVQVEFTHPEQAWNRAAEGLPFGFKASMLQSLERGSITEVDFIHGAVVRWGERVGVATPVNAALVGCIKGIERALQLRSARDRLGAEHDQHGLR